jgi:hypothetical protein
MAKKAKEQEVEQQEIELTGIVTIVGTCELTIGKEFNVTAELAKTLIKKGFAKLK